MTTRRFISRKEASTHIDVSMNTLMRLAKQAKAVVKIGRRTLIDIEKLDKFLEKMEGGK